jgi:hypothetical protein
LHPHTHSWPYFRARRGGAIIGGGCVAGAQYNYQGECPKDGSFHGFTPFSKLCLLCCQYHDNKEEEGCQLPGQSGQISEGRCPRGHLPFLEKMCFCFSLYF